VLQEQRRLTLLGGFGRGVATCSCNLCCSEVQESNWLHHMQHRHAAASSRAHPPTHLSTHEPQHTALQGAARAAARECGRHQHTDSSGVRAEKQPAWGLAADPSHVLFWGELGGPLL
jgi:hypothetical protein